MLLHCFRRTLKGVAALDLRKDVERPFRNNPEVQAENPRCTCGADSGMCKVHGWNWKRMLGALRHDTRWQQRNPTHTWKIREEDGIIQIYDVRLIK